MNTRRAGSTATLLIAAMSLTACGDDSDGPKSDPEHDKAVAALSKRLYEDNKLDKKTELYSKKEADCTAAAVIDTMGVDKLVKLKVLEKDLSAATVPDRIPPAMQKPQIEAISDCIGLVEVWMRTSRAVMLMATQVNPDDAKKPPTDKEWTQVTDCVKERVPEAQMKKIVLASMDDPTAVQKALASKIGPCEKQLG